MADDPQIYRGNLEALRAHPDAYHQVKHAEPYTDASVPDAASGDPILLLPGVDGEERPLHSRYRPREEAEAQCVEPSSAIATQILFGGGMGYLPLAQHALRGTENRLFWLEDDTRVFRTLLGRVDIRSILEHPLTRLAIGRSPRAVYDLLMREVVKILASPIQLIPHPASIQRAPEAYAELQGAINDFSRHGSVQVRTSLYLASRTIENRASNLGPYLLSPGLNPLKGALAGKPLLIVGAGPSLRRNIGALDRLLEDRTRRLPMIGVSTALRLLIARGHRPDFTTLIDYHKISERYFEQVDQQIAPPMITEMRGSREAVRTYPGVQLFGEDPLFQAIFDGTTPRKGEIPRSSSVAATAFHFATWLEADPIIFAGLDLSYPGGLLHVPGTAVHNPIFPLTSRFYSLETRELEYYLTIRRRMLQVPAIPEGDVPTEDTLFSYIKEFEVAFGDYPGRVIDATEGGARLSNCDVASLADVVEEYRSEESPDLQALVEAAAVELNPERTIRDATAVLDELDAELDEVAALYEEGVPILEKVLEKNAAGEPADEEAARLTEIGKQADSRRRITAILREHAQSDIYHRDRTDRQIDSSDAAGVAKQQAQAERDLEFLQALLGAVEPTRRVLAAARDSVDFVRPLSTGRCGQLIR